MGVIGLIVSLTPFGLSFAAVFAEYLYRNNGQDPGNFDHFHRYTICCFAMSTVWLFRSQNRFLTEFLARHVRLNEAIRYLAGISFTVFLIHTWILRVLQILSNNLFFKLGILLLLSFTAAAFLDRLLQARQNRFVHILRLALGLPE
jgi:hypothetical protein